MRLLKLLIVVVASFGLAGCSAIYHAIDVSVADMPGEPTIVGMEDDPAKSGLREQPPFSDLTPVVAFDLDGFDAPQPIGHLGDYIDESLTPQQPFLCETEASDLGQPYVDNQDGFGIEVFREEDGEKTDELIGWSKDCLLITTAAYYYKPIGRDELIKMDDPLIVPVDIDSIDWDGAETMFVVRIEQGTINRFIYTIAALADPTDDIEAPSDTYWNKHLLYYFQGGIGVGRRQGSYVFERSLRHRLDDLRKGYAVAMSTGTQTNNHYNMWLSGNTAELVIKQFEALYAEPEFTIGIGESGGAIQQYIMAENRKHVLDALIPVYSYPDVETQALWIADCDLLEHYFDVIAEDQVRWANHTQRTLVEGVSSDYDRPNIFNVLDNVFRVLSFRWNLNSIKGLTQCNNAMGWRPGIQLIENPDSTNLEPLIDPVVYTQIDWSHYADLKDVYGVFKQTVAGTEKFFANRVFDNVGVQYGLEALKRGEISWAEFLHLNANIGGWKGPEEQTESRYWVFQDDRSFSSFDMWSRHNMTHTSVPVPMSVFDGPGPYAITIAPRSVARSLDALKAPYWAGHVFRGNVEPDLKILDVRHYVDPFLDIHHSYASLATRQRIMDANGGDPLQMKIWVSEFPNRPHSYWEYIDLEEETSDRKRHRLQLLLDRAVDAMYEWLHGGDEPQDACWNKEMDLLWAGDDVWDGRWNNKTDGACTTRFPHFMSTRNAAGAPVHGSTFKCDLVPVADAIGMHDVYLPRDALPKQAALQAVFPDGVCHYGADRTQPHYFDSAMPAALVPP